MNATAPEITLTTPTTGELRSLERIEQAVTDQPFCEACGAPTVPVEEGDAIWLACASTQEHRSIVRRIFSLDALLGHTHQLVLDDLTERLAA
ncbi:MAG: hypothetical protein U0869_02255 [Chloroflexota bacterium]